jgi:hypothetical protein
MRGQRLGERAFEKGDHRAEDTARRGGAKGKVRRRTAWIAAFAALFACTSFGAAEAPVENKWRVLLEPKSMHREVTWEIPGAQRTVFAPVVWERDEYLFPTRKVLEEAGVAAEGLQQLAAPAAAADLAMLKPRYERDRKQVIQYAELTSDRPIVASAVLAPKFLDLFKDTLGEKVLLVVPSRFTAYVFPVLASQYQEYWPMVFEAYRATAWPVSVEVFEVSKDGLRAIGVYQEP